MTEVTKPPYSKNQDEEGFCHLNILLVKLRLSSEDFARTLSFFLLKVVSTGNNILSEKITSLVSVPVFILIFLEVCELLMSLHFQE